MGGLVYVLKTLDLIKKLNPKFFFIENPRGVLRKMAFMDELPIRNTVTYCQYGDTRMKPTDIWTNCKSWITKPMCKNGDTCHTPAPRGSKTGTQGLKGNMERSVVPEKLCLEIIEVCEQNANSPTLPTAIPTGEFNKDLEVSASPTPKESQKAIPSLNPDIMFNKKVMLQR